VSDNLSISGLHTPNAMGYRPPRNRQVLLTPELKRRLIIAGGILCGLAVIGTSASLLGRSGGEVPVLLPDDRPIRVKPVDPGGLKIAGLEAGVYGDGQSDDTPRLAPAPEAPNPSALRAPPDPPRPTTPQPAAQASTPPQAAAEPPGTTRPEAPKPQAATTPAARLASAPPPAVTPAAAPRPTPDAARPPATAKPAPQAQPQTKPPPGRFSVQLAAVRSEASAQAEWQALRLRHPDLFGARQPAIMKTERDGKTFWRVRTTGFADLAEARGFCDRVRAKGATCLVAEF